MTVCCVLNRVPKCKSNLSPYEILKNKKPNVSYMRVWGCLAYVRIPDPKRSKLASRAYECVFIGYPINSKAYIFYDLKNHVIIESNDVDFFEDKFPFKLKDSGGHKGGSSGGASPPSSSTIPSNAKHDDSLIEPWKSKQARTTKDFGLVLHAYTLEEDPMALQEALSSLDADLWEGAINDEMDSLDLHPGCKTIGCKWILKKKLKPDGMVDKYKAQLVAKGYRQRKRRFLLHLFSGY